jgi:hypothetical protein
VLIVNAKEQIEVAHQLLRRVAAGDQLAQAAAELGVPAGSAEKVCWLARVYPPELCACLGDDILCRVRVSHLEVAAALPSDVRRQLLRRAAKESLSVRALKMEIAELRAKPAATNGAVTIGGSAQLEGAAKALDMYVTWPDENLACLLSGANGDVIRRLAKAGVRLNDRMKPADEAA